ncbi:MFS general substrate transporter [Mycena kentingensis (nom. inval.)]|nr:MFS general substrate transporter [Mycena kentingensis (nom. inval.)]
MADSEKQEQQQTATQSSIDKTEEPEPSSSPERQVDADADVETSAMVTTPDGGFEAWATVAGAWLVLFSTFGFAYAFGVFEDYYVRVYLPSSSPSSIAWIGSVQYMLPYFLAPFAGKVFDEGGFRKLEIVGAVVFSFSVFMLSLAKEGQYYQVFLAQAVGMGLGLALTFLPSVSICFHHFRKHAGLASGIALSGSSIGASIFPIVLNRLLPRLGFATAVRVCGAIIVPCLLAGNLLMRTRLPPKKFHNWFQHVGSFLVDPPYMWAVLANFLGLTGLYFPVVYIQLFSIQHGIDHNLAFYSVTMLNAFGTVFRLLGTHWADIFGPLLVEMVCTMGAGIMIFAMLAMNTTAALVIISILYGTFYSTWLALGFACFASLAKGPEEIGARGGLALVFGSIGTLVSSPIQGALLTQEYHWIRPIAFSGTMGVAATGCFLVAYVLHRWRGGGMVGDGH